MTYFPCSLVTVALLFAGPWVVLAQLQSPAIPALIIVNWAYQHSEPLLTPEQDAVVMESTLRQQGFAVEVQRNLTTAALHQVTSAFIEKHKTEPVALIYFSGHGTSMDSQNYLLGTDTNLDLTERWKSLAAAFGSTTSSAFLKAETDMLREHAEQTMFPVRDLLALADDRAGPKQVKMIFLDCCRDVLALDKEALTQSKFALGPKSPGMAPMDSVREKPGLYLGFAAASGQFANQNVDLEFKKEIRIPPGGSFRDLLRQNYKPSDLITSLQPSLFTQYLATSISNGGTLDDVFRSTGLAVFETSTKLRQDDPRVRLQTPAQYGIVYGTFQFTKPAPGLPNNPRPGDLIRIVLKNNVVMSFCYCPPGQWTKGSPENERYRYDDEFQHEEVVEEGYWMAQTECTQAQWDSLMAENPSNFRGPSLPVESITWDEAQKFIQAANREAALPTGTTMSLPTESQWEYACRAGTTTAYSFGSTLSMKQANISSRGSRDSESVSPGPVSESTVPVASYPPNAWNLHDMHGNVGEWCKNRCAGAIQRFVSGTDDPDPVLHTVKDGPYYEDKSWCRAAHRSAEQYPDAGLGFRPCLLLSKSQP